MGTRQKSRRGDPGKAVAYLRASKDEQQLSPEAQRAAIEGWASREGIEVTSWHLDQGVCSVTPIEQRPALCAALVSLRENGAGVLVVAKRDRLARDVIISAMVERTAAAAGARVVSTAGEGNGDTPADQFMRTVIDGAAAYERALIRARTKAALAVKKARGESTGTAPYGQRVGVDGKTLEPDPHEQSVLAELRAVRAAGTPYRAVIRHATDRGLVGRTGRPFTLRAMFAMVASAGR
jgi:DNA invertase Pin-like site-specific DNA recombinase